jgi:Tn7-like transposition protein D
LVMSILGVSAEEFFTSLLTEAGAVEHRLLFPCLNAVCPHFRKNVINGFETKREKKAPARMFECVECGHISSRSADGLNIVRVVRFGDLWERKLKVLWSDDCRSLSNVATELGADARSLLRCALKLDLKFPRRGPTRATARPRYLQLTKRASIHSARDEKRAAWERLRDTHPDAGISELHSINPALYTWLYRHDRPWLNRNSPARLQFVPKNNRVDWNARDEGLVDRVIGAAIRIKSDVSCSRRVTVRSIGMELSVHTLLQIHKNKLPRTKQALETYVESSEQFALRRIKFAKDSIKGEGGPITKSALERTANLGAKARQIPSVQRAIAEALRELEKSALRIPNRQPEATGVLAA